ncbi:MAG: lipoyl protein ligase domain-containing protein, partial [Acidimicrobiales bacterium]
MAASVGAPAGRSVTFHRPDRPLLVLGSTQPADHVDWPAAAAGGVAVVRRSSGGGAVLVEPGALVWASVVVPAGDPLWSPDVGVAFYWLGDAWAGALGALGLGAGGLAVHRGPPEAGPWSRWACFASMGSGEV